MSLFNYDSFWTAHSIVLWSTFAVAFIMGAVVNKTNFCTMGAVSDWVNMGDTGRLRAWVFAMFVAVVGVILLEYFGVTNFNSTLPPYRSATFEWPRFILGGVLFGIGMTLGSGCGNKTLIRIGGGNIKSLVVFIFLGIFAYLMTNPIPFVDTSESLYSLLFYRWINPIALPLSSGQQDLGSIVAHNVTGWEATSVRMVVGIIVAAILLIYVLRSKDFFGRFDNILGGLVVGLCVVGAWYVTSAMVKIDTGMETSSWAEYTAGTAWDFNEDPSTPKPVAASVQSFSFINPIGQTLNYFGELFQYKWLTFGVMAVFGVIAGSLFWAIISRGFRFEWFVNGKDAFAHILGGILMGVGGVLGLGCTVGQGITGISTLAIGSFLTFFSIVIGSATTMKIQYYKLVYEDEATFGKALVTSLVDLKLLPKSWRKLEAV